MWVAVGMVGAAAVGAAGSAAASNSASRRAANATRDAADASAQVQWDMYDQTRQDFQPFLAPSNRALATLQSALYGGPVEYDDASTSALSPEELAQENWRIMQAAGPGGQYGIQDFWDDVGRGEDPISRLVRNARTQNNVPYDSNREWYRGADGNPTTTAPQRLSATWNPQESEGFKYTRSRTLEDLGRSLRMMGRGSGTVAANATGRTLGDLYANNEATQRNELWNLVRTGQGAAGSVQSGAANAANNVSNNAMATGNTLANIANQNGQTQANLWAGLGGTAANAYGAYQMGQYLNGAGAATPTYTPGQGMPLWRNP